MNKHLHRIIFNAVRGQRMVVSETAASHGGSSTGETVCGTTATWRGALRLSAVVLGIGVLCAPAQSQIVADPNAPGNQRPTVLPAANGVPVVNIQTPSAAGVSRNTYSQFDVHSNGAILNNSRTNVQTKQGGWIGSNPWLATGSARVILNEVNSSNPSRLNGYVEVAGQRAEVIIANPAGIQVNGGGFINAAGVTLTSGSAVMNNGSLDSFLVRGGQINVAGLGLDTSTADATRILARAVQVNAGIWAKDLTAVTGTNQVKALTSGSAASATQIASSGPVAGAMPAFALDVAAIGGMYAGKIYMVGTEVGLGMNNQGTLAAQQGALTLQANGQVVNTGRMQAQSALTIQATDSIHNTGHEAVISAQGSASLETGKSITNTSGATMAAVGDLQVKAGGQLDNAASTMAANGAVQITANGVSNQSGTIVSQQSAVDVQAGLAAVNNQQGTLAAAQHANITSGALNNDQGLIQSGAHLAINTQGQTLTNTRSTGHGSGAGGLVADGPITISTGDWNNDAGYAGASGNISATVTGSISNKQVGEIASTADIALSAKEIDNQSGHVQASGNIGLTAADIHNATGQTLANGNVTLTASHSINNAGGTLSAGQHLTVQDNADARSLTITNTAGLAEAGQSVTLRANSLSGDGKLQSAGDLLVDLQGNFESHTDVLASRNAELLIGGAFTNHAKLQSGQNVSVTATYIDNQATGEIAGQKRTTLKAADNLTNRGLIDGVQTRMDAGTLTNIGTGRIYGDHVALAATTLANDTETLDNERKDAVIAARERLDIGASTLINRENALIFSAGSGADALNIGSALDADGYATGQAGLVHNASATIESLGGLSITADLLKNSNEHFSTTLELVGGPTRLKYIQPEGSTAKVLSENFVWESWSRAGQYRYKNSPPINNSGVLGQSPIPRVQEQDCVGDEPNEVCTRQPGADYLADNPTWAYFAITPPAPEPAKPTLTEPARPDESGAGSCTAGAGYNAQACVAYNTALAQYNTDKTAYDQAWSSYATAHSSWKTASDLQYDALDDKIEAYNQRFAANVIRAWTEYNVTRTEYETKVKTSAPGQILSAGDMRLNGGDLANDKSRIIAGGSLTGNLANIASIDAMGEHVIHEEGTSESTWSRWRGGFKRYHQRNWGGAVAYRPVDEVQSLVLPVAEKLEHTQPVGSNTQLATQNQAGTVNTPQSNGLSLSNGTTLGGLPSNSLFKQNPGSNASYLIETDPRFADYRQWLGSDYMLKAMGSDPSTVQKRLGDGFYEQRLIREQVAQLTGRRFLDGHASDEAQYQALMDAGVTVAQNWGLVPGVALSAAQVAALTSDIVWLVAQDVTLADGSVQSVLTPQVYLRPRQGDLVPSGSLLAGQSVDLTLSGDLSNAGTIAGRNVVSINARNIANIGGLIQANTVLAKAEQDINLVGGRMVAQDGLSVQAGRDLNISSTTQSGHNEVGASSFSRTAIDRVAGLYVSDDAGVLMASAGRDMSIVAGVIDNAGKGKTVLQAGGDLRLGTVTTSVQENNVRDANNYLTGGHNQEVGSQIRGSGNVAMVAGGDVSARAATVQADKALAVQAGGSIAVEAGQASDNYSMGYVRKSGGTFNKRSTTVRNSSESTSTVASSLGGETIALQAGKDIAITASEVNALKQTSLTAGRDVTITSDENTETGSSYRASKSSGFSFSKEGLGYSKSSQSGNGSYTDKTQSSSSVTGEEVRVSAGQDVNIRASTVVADEDLNLQAARDVNIVAGTNTSEAAQESHSKSTSLGGFLSTGLGKGVTLFSNTKTAEDGNHDSTRAVSSTVGSLGGNVNILAGQEYTQTGSDVVAPKGDINIHAQTVAITEARETGADTSHQSSSSTTLGARPRNAVVDLVMAAKNTADTAVATSTTGNGRVQAIGAAATALNAYNTANAAANLAKDPSKATSVSIEFQLGSSKSQSSNAQTSDTGRGSHVSAGGDVSIVASGAGSSSDVHVRGSEISAGNSVNLKAEGDVLLESSQDKATLHSSNKSSGGSIGVGISLGSSNGITLSAGVNAARGNANGDDVIQQNTHVLAGNTVTIQSGADTTLAGATVTAPTVKADVGGDLHIESRQDTSSFESKQRSAGAGVTLCIPPICYGTSSVSVSGGKQDIDSDLQSVKEQSGIRAGDGGFQVHVAQDTTLTGGAITSTDKAVNEDKNSFNTGGSLTMSDVQNHAQYQGEGFEFNATFASNTSGQEVPKGHESSVQGETAAPQIGQEIPKGHESRAQEVALAPQTGGGAGFGEDSGSASSVTTSGISGIAGNEAMRTGDAETGVQPIFDKEKVQRELDAQIKITAEFGKQASKAIGDYAQKQMQEAARLQAAAQAESDPQRRAELEAQAQQLDNAWGDNGTKRLLAHTVVGGLTGGASGAAGAALGTVAAPAVADALREAGITGPLADTLTAVASTAAGAVAGGASGAVAAGNEVANNYLSHQKVEQLRACLKGIGCSDEEQKKKVFQNAEDLSVAIDKELNTICGINPTGDACRNAVNAATQYIAMSDAWMIMNKDAIRSSKNLFDYVYNKNDSKKNFVLYFNTIDNRADFFAASNQYEMNKGAGAKWFYGADFVSRALITGLGADGNASHITFAMGRVFAPVYDWRSAAGDELMNSGFDNFKYLYNNPMTDPVQWDIQQLKNEQQKLQPIHEKYLNGRTLFNDFTNNLTDSNVFDWSDKQQLPGGIYILEYDSRVNYGCKLLGYGANQGCQP